MKAVFFKNIKSSFLFVLLVITLVFSFFVLFNDKNMAFASEGNTWDVSLNTDNSIVASYDQNTQTLLITGSGEIKQYPKDSFPWSSVRTQITTVTISGSITNIPEFAFENCPISQINLPDTIEKIGAYAFVYAGDMLSLQLPKNTYQADAASFMDIECVDFSVHPENQYFSEQDGILYDKNKTTIVCAVETITSVDIPDTVTTIGNLAFWKQNLQEISLHEGIETIGTSAFAYSKIKEIVLPQSLKNLGHSAFFSMAKLEKVVLPEKIIDIPAYSFENCINLKQITLPVSVNGICMNAFKGTGLEEVVLPRNVNYIETDAFATNTLKKVTFLGHPYDSYNMIKEDAFGNNTQLTIYAYAGAKGERFAKELGLDLVVMLDWLEVSFVGDIVYNGQEQKPAFSSRYLPSDFKEGVDYTIVYKNNIEPGEATAEITGIGKYMGTCVAKFQIAKITPQVQPVYDPILTKGKTLADANIRLGENLAVSGSITWEQSLDTVVSANSKYKWIFVPDDQTFYKQTEGEIILFDHQTHSYSDWIVEKEATTDEAGSEYRECTVCGHSESQKIQPIEKSNNVIVICSIGAGVCVAGCVVGFVLIKRRKKI